jgi:hypothetical protein
MKFINQNDNADIYNQNENEKNYNISQQYNKLCSPSAAFLVISATSLILMTSLLIVLFVQKQNITKRGPLLLMLLMLKITYILFWTWVLDLICKSGHDELAWSLVFAPYVLVLLAVIMRKLN